MLSPKIDKSDRIKILCRDAVRVNPITLHYKGRMIKVFYNCSYHRWHGVETFAAVCYDDKYRYSFEVNRRTPALAINAMIVRINEYSK